MFNDMILKVGPKASIIAKYRDPPSGTILTSNIITINKDAAVTTILRQEYCDAEETDFDFLSTKGGSRISFDLTVDDQVEDIQNLQHCLKGLLQVYPQGHITRAWTATTKKKVPERKRQRKKHETRKRS